MENSTTLAITKSVSKKETTGARSGLEPGEYEVDTTVRITGKLKVGKDYEKRATASILNQEFLMLVLHYGGFTRDAAVALLGKVASDYLNDWDGSDEDKEAAKKRRKAEVEKFDPEGKVQAIFDEFKGSLPMIPSKGKVSWKGSVEELGLSNVTEIEVVEGEKLEI